MLNTRCPNKVWEAKKRNIFLLFLFHRFFPFTAILATSGVTGALFAVLQMLNGRGVKKIGVTNPFYTYHGKHIELATGNKPVFVQLDHAHGTFSFDWESLETQLKVCSFPSGIHCFLAFPPKNGMGGIIVCNPGNPSGKVYSREELERLVEITGRYNCMLIMDEIYADLVWAGNTFYSPVQTTLHKHVVACRGFSKNVACQSWRVGYLISHPETVDVILNFHDPIYISVPILQVTKFLSFLSLFFCYCFLFFVCVCLVFVGV